ncbi:hypothetical protein [Aurantivibrio plasticivorans]
MFPQQLSETITSFPEDLTSAAYHASNSQEQLSPHTTARAVTSLSIELPPLNTQQQSLSLSVYRHCLLSSITSALTTADDDLDQSRWVTVIVDSLTARWLASQTLNSKRLRIIRVDCNDDALWSAWEALALGNSMTVIAALTNLTSQEKNHLEQAAQKGSSRALLINQLISIPSQHVDYFSPEIQNAAA